MARNKDPKGFVISNAQSALQKLTLPNLKRHCIVRGMLFEDVGNKSILQLQSWLIHHFDMDIHPEKLDEYDDWADALLKSRNVDETFLNAAFRLGHVAERDEEGNVTKVKQVRGIKKKKKRRERTQEGIFSGTKKAYTVELQKQGLSKADVTEMVKAKFPDAKDKSISIWFNKAKKGTLR